MVPKGWKIVTLKDLLDGQIKNGYSPNATDSETGYWVLSLGALADEGINSSGIKPVLPEEKVLQNLLKKDDFLVSRSNTPDKVGRSIRFKNEIENCTYPDLMMRFRIDDTKADKEFIEQQLKSSTVRAYFKNCAAGSSSTMVKINKGILEKTPIVVPPIKEQKKIAQILSTWDNAISVTEKLLTNSQQQKKALMQQLLTGKKRLLDENGVRFSGDWGKFTLSHFGKCIRGVSYKPENICENESDNTIRLLRSTNIQNGELNDKDLIILPKKLVKPMQVLMDGDLAICMANGSKSLVGKSAPYKPNDADYTVGAFCALFRPLKSVSSSFVKFLFESNQYQSQLLVILAGSSINNLKGSDIESINIDAPLHYKEQQKIAAVLSAADAEISTLEKKLACLRDEKKALMQQLLTGKRRVKVDEAVAV
ncbi:restriction endonuclease subunit S [Escherichia coli]|uniref:restriction endonuclease subunit S n=1 Tax=Escherichia coli TaxID=562 RepID=UPI00351CF432